MTINKLEGQAALHIATERAGVNDLTPQQVVERNRRRATTEKARVDGLSLQQAYDRKRKRTHTEQLQRTNRSQEESERELKR